MSANISLVHSSNLLICQRDTRLTFRITGSEFCLCALQIFLISAPVARPISFSRTARIVQATAALLLLFPSRKGIHILLQFYGWF